MSDLIDLTKKVQVVLDLRKISADVKAAVCLCIDGSGSMDSLYRRGVVQNVVNRISAIACKFDDNQELDVFAFSTGCNEAAGATPAMFGTYVQKELLNKGLIESSGTNYGPFIKAVVDKYFSIHSISDAKEAVVSGAKSIFGAIKGLFTDKSIGTSAPATVSSGSKAVCGYPVFVIVITDGENQDQGVTAQMLTAMQDKDIYWQFVGIGNERFSFLKKIANDLPNVGFFDIPNIEVVKDMDLYKNLVSEEFAAWVKKF